MTEHAANDLREFRVRARHDDVHHGRFVTEPSFEAAAIAYVEHLPLSGDDASQISVVVHDVQSGHEHCFRIDVHSGETKSCG